MDSCLDFSFFTEMDSGSLAFLLCLERGGRPRLGLAGADLGLLSKGASALDGSVLTVFSCSGMY